MNYRLLIYSLAFFCFQFSHSQVNYFGELDLNKSYSLHHNYSWGLGGVYKQQLNDENGWKQPSISVYVKKKFNDFWQISAGLRNIYTKQTTRDNFYELRPWISPSLNVPIIQNRLLFQQTFKYELRNFIYSNDALSNETQNRARYKIHFDYKLGKNKERKDIWSINTGYEWYFLKEPATGEQFSSSREFVFKLTKVRKNKQSFSISYSFEQVNIFKNPNSSNSHVYSFIYNF